MKYKLSLSLLTAMALSSGQLYAAVPKIDEICQTPGVNCTITNNNNTNGSNTNTAINITESTIKDITADNSKLWTGSGNTQINKIELKNNSSLEDGGGMVLEELSSDGSAKIIHNRGTTNIKKITSTSTNTTTKTDFESKDGYLDIGDRASATRNEIKNAFFHGSGSTRFFNVKADDSIEVKLGYLSLENSELNGTKISLERDVTLKNNIINNVTITAPTGLVGVAEGNTITNSKIDAKGTYTKNTFTNTEVGLNTTSEINLNENTFKGGKLKAQGKYTNNTFSKDDSGKGTDIDANISGYMHFVGKNTFDGVNMHRNTADQSNHNVVLDSNTEIIFTDSTLSNISINGNSNNSVNNKLTITGGTLTNTTVGSHSTNTNVSDLTLDGVTIDNSGVTNLDHNLRAQNITITNVTNATGAKINAETKLDMTGSTLDATSAITAKEADIKTSTVNGATNVTNTLTSTSSTFGGTVTANDLVSQKDATSGTNSTFNGIVNITNSITSSDTTFTKDVKANTINANSGSSFNANTTATNKITSDGAKFGGIVKANELETLANNKSTFKDNVDIASKITSTNASFEKEVKTAFLDAQKDSTFGANSNVNATDIKATGATFSGTIAKNNSITADNSTFEKAIDTGKLTASNGSTFDGTVKAGDLETLAGAIASEFGSTVNVTNTLTSTNANFTGNVTAGAITANNGSSFGGITKANTIIANSGSVFNGITKSNNSITSTGATFNNEVHTSKLTADKTSIFSENSKVYTGTLDASGVSFNGLVDLNCKDIAGCVNNIENTVFNNLITQNTIINNNFTANTITANNGSVFDTTSKVVVKDSIIANAGSKFHGSVSTDFLAADKGAEFTGTTDVRQLYAKGSNFGGTVTIDCEDPIKCGSVIDDSKFINLVLNNKTEVIIDNGSRVDKLTLNDTTKATLDKGSSVGGLNLTSPDNEVTINGGSVIDGKIENEGVIIVNNGTISSEITGSGDLQTNEVKYTENVTQSDIKGSGSVYEKDATATNSAIVDNSEFKGNFKVDGKLTAYQGNVFNTVSANSADFSYNAKIGEKKEISANEISVTTGLLIDNIDVTSNKISANTATIKNSANVSSTLVGAGDNAAKVYEANIAKGNTYNIDSSKVVGGIRADKLNANNSIIHAQVATNTLNATNTTFYIYGNGFGENDSLYKGYSGAIIAREGAIGSGNSIQLANTNLSNLTQGFVPVAIVKQSTTNRSDASSSIGEDFFKVTYKSKLAMYELIDKYKHFSDINGNYVWSVGVSGEDLVNNTNIDAVISGADSTNIANGIGSFDRSSLEVNVGDMFKPIDFDKEAIDTAKFILTSPEYIVRTKTNTLNKRFRALKDHKLGNGFWLDNEMGYARYEYNAIRYKNMSVGIDKTHEFNDSDLSVGLAAVVGHAETKGNLNSDADSKGFGVYALNKFNNNAFIGASAFYHNISSSYEAQMLDIKTSKNHNVYEASLEGGARFGDSVYFEPSLKYHLTSYKPTAITQKGLVLKGDSQLKHELTATLEGGFKVPNIFDAYLALGLSKELNHKPDLTFIDELKIENKVEGSKGDTSVGINFGVDYKLSPKASFNIDLGSNLYNNSDKELKGNIGFNYQF